MMTILRPLSVMTPGPGDPEVAYAKQGTSTAPEPVYRLFLYGQVSTTIPLFLFLFFFITVKVVQKKKKHYNHIHTVYYDAYSAVHVIILYTSKISHPIDNYYYSQITFYNIISGVKYCIPRYTKVYNTQNRLYNNIILLYYPLRRYCILTRLRSVYIMSLVN